MRLDTPARIYNAPANLFVAGFIGAPSMNFLRGSLAGGRLTGPGVDVATAVAASVDSMPRVADGLGVTILSTPQGVMADHEARERNVGGEVLCKVF